jgi:hypothetical protein
MFHPFPPFVASFRETLTGFQTQGNKTDCGARYLPGDKRPSGQPSCLTEFSRSRALGGALFEPISPLQTAPGNPSLAQLSHSEGIYELMNIWLRESERKAMIEAMTNLLAGSEPAPSPAARGQRREKELETFCAQPETGA